LFERTLWIWCDLAAWIGHMVTVELELRSQIGCVQKWTV